MQLGCNWLCAGMQEAWLKATRMCHRVIHSRSSGPPTVLGKVEAQVAVPLLDGQLRGRGAGVVLCHQQHIAARLHCGYVATSGLAFFVHGDVDSWYDIVPGSEVTPDTTSAQAAKPRGKRGPTPDLQQEGAGLCMPPDGRPMEGRAPLQGQRNSQSAARNICSDDIWFSTSAGCASLCSGAAVLLCRLPTQQLSVCAHYSPFLRTSLSGRLHRESITSSSRMVSAKPL